jgi:hypothetical protein
LAFDQITEATLTPWYREQIDRDYQRATEIKAAIEGCGHAADNIDTKARWRAALAAVAGTDPDVARAFMDVMSCLSLPEQVMSRPGLQDKVATFMGAQPGPTVRPTRADLLALVN